MNKQILLPAILLCCITLSAQSQSYEWAKGMGGADNDFGRDLCVDNAGNTYVTGDFTGTADFDPGPGTVNLVSAGSNDVFFAKYDPQGNLVWARRVGGAASDVGYAIRTDNAGHIYISGYFASAPANFDPAGTANLSGTGGSYDIFFAKYDTAGNYIWARRIGGTGADNAWAMQLDAAGNIYLGGYFWATVDFDPGTPVVNLISSGNYDAYIAKYDSGGNHIWSRRMGGADDDKTYAIGLDPSGNISATGVFSGTANFNPAGTANLSSGGQHDVFVARYDNGGSYTWAKALRSTGDDYGWDVAADPAGNVFVTGYFQNTLDFSPGVGSNTAVSNGSNDLFIARYDNAGNYVWGKGIGSSGSDLGMALTLDDSNKVYVTGRFDGTVNFNPGATPANLVSAGSQDVFIAKYDAAGTYAWGIAMGGAGADGAWGIRKEANAVYITGDFQQTADFDPDAVRVANLVAAGNSDIFLAKYNLCIPADLPVLAADHDTICNGSSAVLSITSGLLHYADHWQWSLDSCGGKAVDTGSSVTVAPGVTTTYYVHGTGGCAPEGPCATITIYVTPLPSVVLEAAGTPCDGDTIQLRSSVSYTQPAYLWSTGATTPTIGVTQTGWYSLEVTERNCKGRDSISVTFYPRPLFDLGNDTVICAGASLRIGAELPDITGYLWSTGSTDPHLTVNASGTYWLQMDRSGCTGSDTIGVTVAPMPEVDLGGDRILCPEQTIVLDAGNPGASYRWSTGDTTATLSVTLPGDYAVTVISPYQCAVSDSIRITYLPLPVVELGPDTVVCEETPLQLLPYCEGCDSRLWSDGSDGPALTVNAAGMYFVSGINQCGTTADTINVRQIFCDIWLPNAFTPNGDGRNDILRVLGNTGTLEHFSFSIYNRWGERIFYTSDNRSGWDGKYKGGDALLGTYVYVLEYTRGGQHVLLKGNFHLLR